MRRLAGPGALLALAFAALVPASAALAQEQEPSALPPPPPGTGVVRGLVVHPDGPEHVAGLDVALYALAPDGTPGLQGARTDAKGEFRFEGVSSDPSVVYLVGARYGGVPFGQRAQFAPEQSEVDVLIEVSDATRDASEIDVAESIVRLEWSGSRLAVVHERRLRNVGTRVVYVEPEKRDEASPVLEIALPEGATDFAPGFGVLGDGFEQRGRRVLYWGPVYPGDQDLRYQYVLPSPPESEPGRVVFEERFPSGSDDLVVLAPEGGPSVKSEGLEAGDPLELGGRRYATLLAGEVPPGRSIRLEVQLPPTRFAPEALSLERVDLVMELDDAALEVTEEYALRVAPGGRPMGSPGRPLARFDLPDGAELLGLSDSAQALGLAPADGAIDVLGPLAPGQTRLAFRYRIPADAQGASVDLRFPRAVPVLGVRIADTGVVVESERLHRLRPERVGTRVYLRREAFQVEPDEMISLRLRPLARPGLSSSASRSLALLLFAAAVLFVIAPLLPRRPLRDAGEQPLSPTAREREAVYASIRDLEHDYETGKVAEEDFRQMQSELRARAVELVRRERAAAHEEREPPVALADARGGRAPLDGADAPGPACPECGADVEAAWRFCARCGAGLGGGDLEESTG